MLDSKRWRVRGQRAIYLRTNGVLSCALPNQSRPQRQYHEEWLAALAEEDNPPPGAHFSDMPQLF